MQDGIPFEFCYAKYFMRESVSRYVVISVRMA